MTGPDHDAPSADEPPGGCEQCGHAVDITSEQLKAITDRLDALNANIFFIACCTPTSPEAPTAPSPQIEPIAALRGIDAFGSVPYTENSSCRVSAHLFGLF